MTTRIIIARHGNTFDKDERRGASADGRIWIWSRKSAAGTWGVI